MNTLPAPRVMGGSPGKVSRPINACPECGRNNLEGAYFCTSCHQILIHRCPNCSHEQVSGGRCEKSGINFALYWELVFERAVEKENRIWWDAFKSALLNILFFVVWIVIADLRSYDYGLGDGNRSKG
jgi:hypothetical protein